MTVVALLMSLYAKVVIKLAIEIAASSALGGRETTHVMADFANIHEDQPFG